MIGSALRTRRLPRRWGALLESLEPRTLLSAYTLSTVAAFGGADGSQPFTDELTIDSAGDIFGATSVGGAWGFGVVYEIPAGSRTISPIASFTGDNGGDPVGRLLLDSAGNIYGVTSGGDANKGTVFVIPHGTHSIATIATFDGDNGAYPIGLTMDAAGNLYGVTQNEGAFGEGNVFEIAKGSGTVTVLGSFTGANGGVPESNLLIDAQGNIFGATEQGGAHSTGALFEIPASTGTLITLASFDANGDNGQSPMGDLVMDSAGDIFGTAQFGGAFNGGQNGNGVVFELAEGAGTITAYASFATADGINPFGGLLMDSAGDMFGTTTNGGTNGAGTIFEIATGTQAITVLASLPGPYGDICAGNLVLDSGGNLFGTTDGGGNPSDNGTIFELSPTASTQLAISQGPSKTVAGQTMNAITVEIQDDQGRVISNDESQVTLALSSNPDGAALSGTTTVSAIGGVATFTDLSISGAGQYTLLATDGDLVPALSNPFSIVPSPLSALGAFDDATGGDAIGQPVMDTHGNIFGVTTSAGAHGAGMIFELQNGASVLTPVAAFDNFTGEIPAGGLIIDAQGDLFGMTTSGGQTNSGTIFELPAGSTTIVPLASFSGAAPAGSLVMDSAGDLFGLTTTGGDNSDGTLFELPANSSSITTLASFTGITWSSPPSNLLIDSGGNLFLATPSGGTDGNGALMEFPATGNALITLASFTFADGISPGSLIWDAAGNIYGITTSGGDNNLGTLFVLPADSSNLAVLASFDPTTGAPSSLSMDAHGNLFGTAGEGLFESPADSGSITALTPLTAATGAGPTALLVDSAGNIFGATTSGGDNNLGMLFRYANAPATHLAFTVEPMSTTAGQALSSITVVDADGDGYPVPSDDSVISLGLGSGAGGAVLQGITTAILQNGYATFSGLSLSSTGTYTLAASDGSLPVATSTSFSINPIVPQQNSVKLAFAAQPVDAVAGTALSDITVTIEDAQGNPVTADNSSISLQIASGPAGAAILGTLVAQAQNGVATFSGLAINTAGTYSLFASDANLLAATSSHFTIHAGAPAHLVFGQGPANSIAGAVISPAVSIALTDAFGNPITSSHATVTLSIHSGPGLLKGATSAALNNGTAVFRNLSLVTAGTYTLAAAGASLSATSDPFTISAAAPARLVFLQPPTSAAAGSTISPAISVALVDRYGNLVTTSPSLVTLSLASGPRGASLSGNIALPLDNGSTSFSDISLATAGTYKVKAGGDGFTVTSAAISITSLAGAHPRRALEPLASFPWQ